MKKPRPLRTAALKATIWEDDEHGHWIDVSISTPLNGSQAKKLSDWLYVASKWLIDNPPRRKKKSPTAAAARDQSYL